MPKPIDRSSSRALWRRVSKCLAPILDGSLDLAEVEANIHHEFMWWRRRCDELQRVVRLREMEMAKHLRQTQRARWRRARKNK